MLDLVLQKEPSLIQSGSPMLSGQHDPPQWATPNTSAAKEYQLGEGEDVAEGLRIRG